MTAKLPSLNVTQIITMLNIISPPGRDNIPGRVQGVFIGLGCFFGAGQDLGSWLCHRKAASPVLQNWGASALAPATGALRRPTPS